jgi:hypothetical protein
LLPDLLAAKASRNTGQIRSRTNARRIQPLSIRLLLGVAVGELSVNDGPQGQGWRRAPHRIRTAVANFLIRRQPIGLLGQADRMIVS